MSTVRLTSTIVLSLTLVSLGAGAVRGRPFQKDLAQAESGAPRVIGSVAFTPEEVDRILALSPLPDPPPDLTNRYYENEAAARFGRALFFDERLSGPGTVSCATCHDPIKGWSDGKQIASALADFPRHTQTVLNVAYSRWFFWDGRKDTLWSQALGPLEDPREHGGSRVQYAHLIYDDPGYRRAYTEIFGELPDLSDAERFPPEGRPVAGDREHPHSVAWASMRVGAREQVNRIFANLGKAIAAFERQLVGRRAPFDIFVEGLREGNATKQRSLSEAGRRGLRLFLGKARCHLCHAGSYFSDLEFHNDRVPPGEGRFEDDLGRYGGIAKVQKDPFNGVGRYSDAPAGEARAKVDFLLRNSHNLNEFKTPTLRNVAVTAPFMHEGQLATLDDVVEFYSKLENALPQHKSRERLLVPVNLTEEEQRDLVEFLESLTDTGLAPELLSAPETPYIED